MTARKVKRSFARGASTYIRHAGLQKDVSCHLVGQFARVDAAPKNVLDIGCGTGFTSLDATRRWPQASVAAIDLAFPMAREARAAGIARVAVADAAAPPFIDGVFDMVVSSLAFQWTPDNAAFYAGVARLLSRNGRLCFAVLTEGTLDELRAAYSRACLECTGHPARLLPFPSAMRLAASLHEAGFINVRRETEVVRRMYGSVDELFTELKGIGATAAGRGENPPRRDILEKTRIHYPVDEEGITATYHVAYFEGERA